jgi:hypothetical protein
MQKGGIAKKYVIKGVSAKMLSCISYISASETQNFKNIVSIPHDNISYGG